MSVKNLYNYIIIIACLLTIGLPISASGLRVKDFTFSHLNMQDGLSSQRVYSLHKTKDNAVWWTTKYGVDRYNGTMVKKYPLGERELYSSFAGRVVKFAHSTCCDDETYVFDNTGCIYRAFQSGQRNRGDGCHTMLKNLQITGQRGYRRGYCIHSACRHLPHRMEG